MRDGAGVCDERMCLLCTQFLMFSLLPVFLYLLLPHLSVVHWFIQPLSICVSFIFSVFLFLPQRELPLFLTFFSLFFYLFHRHTHTRTHTDLFFLSQPLVVRSMPPPGRPSLSYSATQCGRVKRQTSGILS